MYFIAVFPNPVYESAGPLFLGILKYLLRCTFFIDDSLVHIEYPRTHIFGKLHLMGYNYHCHPLLGKVFYNSQHLTYHCRVEGRSGFVKQYYLRLH